MDIDKLAEKLKDLIVGELKEEFKEFRAQVRGELEGYRIAIESMSQRLTSIEKRISSLEEEIREINRRIDDLNRRVDDTNQRVDETNRRIDHIYMELSHIKDILNKAFHQKDIVEDIIRRLQKLEEKVHSS